MTTPDETEAPAPRGDSGALERRSSGGVASASTGVLAKADDDERSEGAVAERTEGTVAERDEGAVTGPAAEGDDGGSGEGADGKTAGDGRKRRPLRTSLLVLAAIAVAAAAGVAATGSLGGDSADSPSAAPSGPPATAKVQRSTLTDSETVDGSLGYGDATAVQAPASAADTGSGQDEQGGASGGGASGGTITWLPEDGKVVERGQPVYRVDQQKVPLLYGSFPLYRTLEPGTEGADVTMLEKNLRALGYTGFTADDTYTTDTADAVRQWQDDLNREETGTVRQQDAVVAPGARRIADVKAAPGAALSGNLLSWTGTERIVAVDLDVQFEDLVEEGTKATVELPDNTTVEAEVTDIGTPSTPQESESGDAADSGGGSDSGSDEATLPVELTVKDQKGLGRYQAAAVDVTLKADSRENVLVVPVNALVAQRGGGYAVEVVTADGTEYRPVKLGMFADGKVEVSGTGIKEGTVVGVPK